MSTENSESLITPLWLHDSTIQDEVSASKDDHDNVHSDDDDSLGNINQHNNNDDITTSNVVSGDAATVLTDGGFTECCQFSSHANQRFTLVYQLTF